MPWDQACGALVPWYQGSHLSVSGEVIDLSTRSFIPLPRSFMSLSRPFVCPLFLRPIRKIFYNSPRRILSKSRNFPRWISFLCKSVFQIWVSVLQQSFGPGTNETTRWNIYWKLKFPGFWLYWNFVQVCLKPTEISELRPQPFCKSSKVQKHVMTGGKVHGRR